MQHMLTYTGESLVLSFKGPKLSELWVFKDTVTVRLLKTSSSLALVFKSIFGFVIQSFDILNLEIAKYYIFI